MESLAWFSVEKVCEIFTGFEGFIDAWKCGRGFGVRGKVWKAVESLEGWAGGHSPSPIYILILKHFQKVLECLPDRRTDLPRPRIVAPIFKESRGICTCTSAGYNSIIHLYFSFVKSKKLKKRLDNSEI